jgi:hypothetical protein
MARWSALVKPPDGPISDLELQELLETFRDEVLKRKGRYVTVVDLRGSPGITATQRKRLSGYIRETEAQGVPCCGTALVFDSSVLRGVLTAIFWLKQPAHPVQVFATVEEAIRWAHQAIAGESPGSRRPGSA